MSGFRSEGQASRGLRASSAFGLVALASAAGVVVALVSQHVFGMQPCPWCVLQRLILLAIGLVALLGWRWRAGAGRSFAAMLLLGLSLCGAAAALWQHFRAAASASCNLTLADRIVTGLRLDAALPDVFEARASCADAAVSLLGVPYDFLSLAAFAAIAAVSGWMLSRGDRLSDR